MAGQRAERPRRCEQVRQPGTTEVVADELVDLLVLAEHHPAHERRRRLPDALPQRPSFKKDRVRPGSVRRGRPANIRHMGAKRGKHRR